MEIIKVGHFDKALPRRTFRHLYGLQIEDCLVNNWGKLSWDTREKI